jgi:hypothetical protein
MTTLITQPPSGLAAQPASQRSTGPLCPTGDRDGRSGKENTMTAPTCKADFRIPVTPPTSGERRLAREIKELWIHVQDREREKQFTDAELEGMRSFLGEKLYCMQDLLAMCGRGEQWPRFLHRRRIPQLTAEQLIAEHAVASSPNHPTSDSQCIHAALPPTLNPTSAQPRNSPDVSCTLHKIPSAS